MQFFRKVAGNILAKVLLAFVALTFVLFGISDFILGSPSSWVVRVGGTTISNNALNKAMKNDRELILNSRKDEEVVQYLDSQQFRSDVLSRMVNKIMIEKLSADFGVKASKKIILGAVVDDPTFKNKEGKFDHDLFKRFLSRNGLTQEKYVEAVAAEITASMVLQTLSMTSPNNHNTILETENFRQEKRVADVITLSIKDIRSVEQPSASEVESFFAENKKKYSLPEMRSASYVRFSKQDFAKYFQVSDAEIQSEYEKNKDSLMTAESRDFYHLLFDDEAKAKEFLEKLNAAKSEDKSKNKIAFVALAKELERKDQKAITLKGITKRDFIPEIVDDVFQLSLNDYSSALKSPLGFHVFFLTDIVPAKPIPFSEAKISIRKSMLEGREEKVMQEKISEINDLILTSNSLTEVAKKFGFKVSNLATKISQAGQNESGQEVAEAIVMGGFTENLFSLKNGQISRAFQNAQDGSFYIVKSEETIPAHDQELEQVKSRVLVDLLNKKRNEALFSLAQKVGEELKNNPNNAQVIAAQYKLKLEKQREFPRAIQATIRGKRITYPSPFLDELFGLKVGQVTSALAGGESEFVIGILRDIKEVSATSEQFETARAEAVEGFRAEVLQEFNAFLMKKNPVKINEKALSPQDK